MRTVFKDYVCSTFYVIPSKEKENSIQIQNYNVFYFPVRILGYVVMVLSILVSSVIDTLLTNVHGCDMIK